GDPPEGWGLSRAKRAKKRRRPPGSRVRKTLLPRVTELLREPDNPKFDQKSPVNGYEPVLFNAEISQIKRVTLIIRGAMRNPQGLIPRCLLGQER
ncbi:MAG: hypothetical protein B5M55_06795, partial [Desulfococcus sp. 4484_242]